MNDDILNSIVQSGILAPSADNRHVFRYELAVDSISLWPSPEFANDGAGHRRILGLISLGAVVENMRLQAEALGFATDTKWWIKDPISHGMVAQLTFSPTTVVANGLAIAIPERHTNRRMYHGPTLSSAEKSCLTDEIASSQGVQLLWLQGKARNFALKLLWQAESERFLRRSLHQEIFDSIRFDLSWTESSEWALPPGALEIEAPMRPLFKALRRWSLMRVLNVLGAHHLVGMRAGWLPCWQAPALAVLVTTLPLDKGAVATGAALERVWLKATRLELAMQPLAAAVILPLQKSVPDGASDSLRLKLANGWREISPGATPLMVFRIGRAKPPTVRSQRLPRTSLLLEKSIGTRQQA